jgi:hypothetical protein
MIIVSGSGCSRDGIRLTYTGSLVDFTDTDNRHLRDPGLRCAVRRRCRADLTGCVASDV